MLESAFKSIILPPNKSYPSPHQRDPSALSCTLPPAGSDCSLHDKIAPLAQLRRQRCAPQKWTSALPHSENIHGGLMKIGWVKALIIGNREPICEGLRGDFRSANRLHDLDGALRGIFEKWYPGLAANDSASSFARAMV